MPDSRPHHSPRLRFSHVALLCVVGTLAGTPAAQASNVSLNTQLWSADLNGTGAMPLGPNWSDVASLIHLGEAASTASFGRVAAIDLGGGLFEVSSFFDVFFDLTITDIDPVNDFTGGAPSLTFQDAGALHLTASYQATFNANDPGLGLFLPPASAAYSGTFILPLGADFNGNSVDDKLVLALSLAFDDENRTFIVLPDRTVIHNADASAVFSGGVFDVTDDPPFGPITLTGPTTASSRIGAVPEPASMALLGLGMAAGAWARSTRRGRRRS